MIDINSLQFVPAYTGGTYNGLKKCGINKPKQDAPGVYFIKENGELVYIGISGSTAWKRCYRHFHNGNESHRNNYGLYLKKDNSYEICIVNCTKEEVYELERVLLIKHQPRDNKYIPYEAPIEEEPYVCPF